MFNIIFILIKLYYYYNIYNINVKTGSEDLSSFSKQFTEMSTDSITINTGSKASLTSSVPGSDNSVNNSRYNLFRGFSFVADHLI